MSTLSVRKQFTNGVFRIDEDEDDFEEVNTKKGAIKKNRTC